MPVRSGSWEKFHHHIRWSQPPAPAAASMPSVMRSAAVAIRAPRPQSPRVAAQGPSGLGDVLLSLWKGFCGGR